MSKYRSFMLQLYPDCDLHTKILEYIKEEFSYACILHDKDVNLDGTLKKPHYHVVIKFKDQRTINSVSNELLLTPNYIEPTRHSYIYALRYLVHLDNPEKYQYSLDEVEGDLKNVLLANITNQKPDENLKILELVSLIDGMGFIKIRDFVYVTCKLNLYSYYRRSASIINSIIIEHNNKIGSKHSADCRTEQN